MASELRVNTLKDASGNNSVATSVVFAGSAKAWANFDGTSTLSTRDSYNVGSTTDNSTGNYTNNFTNNMVNDDFSASTDSQDATTRTNVHSSFEDQTTGTLKILHYEGGSSTDTNRVGTMVMGDLA
jgi:hypothetical protein